MTRQEAHQLIESMSAEDRNAITEFANENGRNWKSKVREMWDKGTDQGVFRRLRNSVGPSGLEHWGRG